MAESIYFNANVEVTDTFATWVSKTNDMIYDMATIVMTTSPTSQPNTMNGGFVTGNSQLEGIFSANTIAVATNIRGGTVSAPSNLNVVSNTVFSASPLVSITNATANLHIAATSSTITSNTVTISNPVGNTTVNTAMVGINGATFRVSSTNTAIVSTTANITGTTLNVTSNTSIGAASLNADVGTFTIGSNASDTLNVNSKSDFNSNVNIDGILTATANVAFTGQSFTVGGNTTVGDSTSDRLVVNAYLNSDLVPTSNTIDLGTNANPYGNVHVDNVYTNTKVSLIDNAILAVGTGDDLEIYHNGTKSIIENATGDLNIKSNTLTIQAFNGVTNFVSSNTTGAYLYSANSVKFETLSTGAKVTGALTVTGSSSVGGTSAVTGAATFANTVSISGATTIANNVSIAGSANTGTLSVNGRADVTGDMTVYGVGVFDTDLYVLGTLTAETVTSGTWNAGTVTSNGAISATNFTSANGVAAAPGYDFDGDTKTGMFLVSPGTLGFSTNGTISAALTSSSNLRLYNTAGTFYTEIANQPTSNRMLSLPDGNVTLVSGTMVPTTGVGATGTWSITANNAINLNGQAASYYLNWANVTNKPSPTVTVELTGDIGGSANATLTNLANGTISIATTIQPNSVALGTNTTGNYVASLVPGTGVSILNNTGESTTPTISIGQDVGTAASVQFANMVVSGNLTVNGTTTAVNTTNVSVKDTLIELNSGASTSVNDSGILINRGTTGANAFFGWDESADKFIVGTTTAGGTSTGNLTVTAGTIVAATFEGTATRVGNSLTTGSYLIGSDYDGSKARSWSVDASTTSLASTLVARDASQNIAANTVFADLSGNASTASKVNNTVTFNNSGSGNSSGITFDGSTARTISYNTIGAAPISSPALTGTPTAPTAAVGTNNTQIATTAFVITQIADDAPTKTGGGASGTWGIAISGNAATATNATNADKIYAAISSGASAYKVPFLNTTGTSSADYGVLHDSAATFTYNPSTNTLTVGTVVGNLSGNASTATRVNNALTCGSYLTGDNFNGSAATTWAVDATSANTPSKVVARNASGSFSAGTIIATFNGDGSNVTNIDAANISTGVLSNSRLALTWGTINGAMAGMQLASVGAIAFCQWTGYNGTNSLNVGDTVNGASLKTAGVFFQSTYQGTISGANGTLTGTWKALGYIGGNGSVAATLFIRIS